MYFGDSLSDYLRQCEFILFFTAANGETILLVTYARRRLLEGAGGESVNSYTGYPDFE